MIYLALGSSLGDGPSTFLRAEKFLTALGIKILAKSSNHTTKPYGGVAKNDFTNAVWSISTDFSAFGLLKLLQHVEKLCERTRNQKWEDRTLDLDLLSYFDEKIDTDWLKVPHPEMSKRDFVLIPLSEVKKMKN